MIAQPARWVIVAAKAAVASGFGLVMGDRRHGRRARRRRARWSRHRRHLRRRRPPSGGALLLTSMAPLFGLGVGMILKHSAHRDLDRAGLGAASLENLIRGFAPPTVSRYMPFSAANGLLGIRRPATPTKRSPLALSRVQDAFLFGGYVVAALAIGTLLLYRRDPN